MPGSGGTSNLSMSRFIVAGLTLRSRLRHHRPKDQHTNAFNSPIDGARLTSGLGHSLPKWGVRPTSAFPPIATELRTSLEVRFVPIVLQKSKMGRHRKSRERRILGDSAAAM